MSRPFEHGGIAACGVLLGALELLSIAAVARWPAVDDPEPRWTRAVRDAAADDAPGPDGADVAETEASVLLGRQVLDRAGAWVGTGAWRAAAVRFQPDRQRWHRVRRAPGRPCGTDRWDGCD